jgi:hypothetical protein
LPPLHARIHPNVVIQYCGGWPYLARSHHEADMAGFAGWAGTGAQTFWRPNWLPATMGMPFSYGARFAADIRRLVRECRLLGTDFDTQQHNWGGKALTFYVMAETMWDADRDAEAMAADYVEKGFGKAAPAVAAYFRRVRRLSDAHIEHWQPKGVDPSWFDGGPQFYDERFFADAQGCLQEAARLAEADSDGGRRRVRFLAENLSWAEIEAAIMRRAKEYRRGDATQRNALADLERRRLRWYEEHKTTWTVYAPVVRYLEDRYRADLTPIPEAGLAGTK